MSYGNSALGNNELGSTATASRPVFGTQAIAAEYSLAQSNIQYFLTQGINSSYSLETSSLQDLYMGSESIAAEYGLDSLNLTTGLFITEDIDYAADFRDAEISGTTTIQPSEINASYTTEASDLSGETLMGSDIIMSDYTLEGSDITPVLKNSPVDAAYTVQDSIITTLATNTIDASAEIGSGSLQDLYMESGAVSQTYSVGETRFDILGRSREVNVYVNGTRIDSYKGLEIEERLNEPDTFSFDAFIVEDSQRGLIAQGNDVKVLEGFNLLFKGRLEEVNYKTAFEAECQGEGMETKLLDRKTGREEYLSTPADDIVRDIAPTDTVTLGTIENAPTTSIRFDHDNKARGVAGVANAVGYDWRLRQDVDDDFETDYLDFVSRIGGETPVKTFSIGEDAKLVSDGGDDSFVANDITLLGRGDGINQLEARVYAAAADYTQLTSDVSETASTIPVDDAAVLGDVGDNIVVKIGVELVDVDITDSTTLTVNSRGVTNFEGDKTAQILHREGVSVWLYENKTQGLGPFTPETKASAQNGSSINSKGVKQLRDTDKTIIKLPTLEVIADRELRNRYEDVKQIEVRPTDPRIAADLEIGDVITINDGLGADITGDFRIVGMDHKRMSSGEGTVLHCANRPRRLVERLSEINRDKDTLNAHMQGATNIDTQSFTDNCDQENPLKTKIYVPEDAVAVNKVELTAAREDFRGYVQNDSHKHTINKLPNHKHDVEISIDDHSHGMPNDALAKIAFSSNLDARQAQAEWDTDLWYKESLEFNNITDSRGEPAETSGIQSGSAGSQHTHGEWQFTPWVYDLEPTTSILNSETVPENNFSHEHVVDLTGSGQWAVTLDFDQDTPDTTKAGGSIQTTPTSDNNKATTTTESTVSAGDPVYGIFEQNETNSIDIDVVVDGTTVQTITGVSPGQEITDVIRVEEDLSEPIAGEWHDLRLVPSSQTRLTANVFKKVFIESTV